MGIEGLFELFEQGFPSPASSPLPKVYKPSGVAFGSVSCDPEGPLVAEVVRTTSDPFVGRLSLVRVFSGTLSPDTPLHVSGHLQQFASHHVDAHPDHDSDDRVGPLSAPLGDETRPKPYAIAGDLVLVSKLAAAETSDTLSNKAQPALVEPWLLPEPLLPVAVHATSRGDEEKMASALQRLVAEDVTMRLEHNAETHQVVIWAMGPAHVEKLLTALRENWHIQVQVEPVRTSLRETFIRPITAQGRLVKQSGGHGQYAVCMMEIEPLERGAGFEFTERVVGGSVPRQFIPSVEKGVRGQLAKGVLAGYPLVDLRVTLVDGKAHSVDSSIWPFRRQGRLPSGRLPMSRPLPFWSRSTKWRSRLPTTRSGQCWRTFAGRRSGDMARRRPIFRGTPSSMLKCQRTSSPGTRLTCARSPMAPAPSSARSCVTTTCQPRWPVKSSELGWLTAAVSAAGENVGTSQYLNR